MMKKSLAFLFFVVLLAVLVVAQTSKIEVSTTKESYLAGENVTVIVSLLDSQNNPVSGNVNLVFEDSEKKNRIEKTIEANKPVDVSLGENALAGYWKITASYKENDESVIESTTLFFIQTEELARFELSGDVLTITNTGNSRYSKNVQILIGESIGSKEVDLGIGESVSFRLIAPDGTYSVKVTDGKTSLTRSNVALTGNVIGILDERLNERTPLTVGISPENASDVYGFKNSTFVYIFVVAVLGAMILLAIERRYRRKAKV